MVKWKEKDLMHMGITISADGNVGMKSLGAMVSIDQVGDLVDLANKRIFIPGEVRSSKNTNRIAIVTNKTGKAVPRVCDSGPVEKYKKATKSYYEILGPWFKKISQNISAPIVVEFQFLTSQHPNWDFANIIQVVQDLMVEHKWLEDDNVRHILPVPNIQNPYVINKENPGVWIKVVTNKK